MNIKHTLWAILAVALLCPGCVDPDYNLEDAQIEGPILQGIEVPIGNFEKVTLGTILGAEGAALLPSLPGYFTLTGSATLWGVDLRISSNLYFTEAELHTVILNTMPLDLNISVIPVDYDGNTCQDVTVKVDTPQTPMIAAGTEGKPSSNPMTIRLTSASKYISLYGFRLVFSGRTGEGFEGQRPTEDEGITLTEVVLKMPEGFILDGPTLG